VAFLSGHFFVVIEEAGEGEKFNPTKSSIRGNVRRSGSGLFHPAIEASGEKISRAVAARQ
jgi:hypothetical protein